MMSAYFRIRFVGENALFHILPHVHCENKVRGKVRYVVSRTNGRAYATVLRLSVRLSVVRLSVCDVMYCS